MSISEIGCCGAYCKTCKVYGKNCLGCKIGYDNGQRDIGKAKCSIKVCCVNKGLVSCGVCPDYEICEIISGFHHKNSYKYSKYHESCEYIREYGAEEYCRAAQNWSNAYGKLK